jgi:acetyl-CoA/propionyl-CoA carboxylase biotin carboxyl carrier protein
LEWVTVLARSAVSQYYDNLLSKVIVWGRDREEALSRSRRALREYTIGGIATTIPFHIAALDLPAFVAGEHHTRTVEEEMDLSALTQGPSTRLPEDEELAERQITVEVGGGCS